MLKRALVGLGLGLAAGLVALGFGQLEFASRMEDASYDLRVRQTAQPAASPSPIVVVEINEPSIQALEPIFGRWPWPRLVHSFVISYLKRAGAKVVVYDVMFGERDNHSVFTFNGKPITGAESDEAFVNAVRDAGNVVLAVNATFEDVADPTKSIAKDTNLIWPGTTYAPGEGFRVRPGIQAPFPELAGVAAGFGHTLLVRETDGSARRMEPFVTYRGLAVPSLGVAGALAAQKVSADDVRLEGDVLRLGVARAPVRAGVVPSTTAGGAAGSAREIILRYPRPVTGADQFTSIFPTYSFLDVLLSEDRVASGQPPPVPEAVFKDKIVLIGLRVANTNENFTTPFGGGADIVGVELHATLAHNILTQQFMRRSPVSTDIAITMAMSVAVGLVATLVPAVWATMIVTVMAAGLGAWLTREVGQGVWLAAVTPLVGVAVALFGGVAWQYLVEDRAKRHVKQLFGRYVSKDVIAQLMADPARAQLGGQRREMSVLFTDIRGFTTNSEAGTPEDVVAQLNEYFSAMVDVLFKHQGTLDKFVGDMVMGLFGAPLDDPKHADHAVLAALDMRRELARLNAKWKAEGRPELDFGTGINSGEMIAGNIGSQAIMSYTVIGDAVNLGARLESLNKDLGTDILISEDTRARLTIPVETRAMGDIKVKGKTKAVPVFEIKSPV